MVYGIEAMMKAILLLSLLCSIAQADVRRASCKFGGGVAFVYREDQSNYYLLTAGHCIANQQCRVVQFFHSGRSPEFPVSVKTYRYDPSPVGQIVFDPSKAQGRVIENDIGILVLRKEALGTYPRPSVIPLATDESYELELRDRIILAPHGEVGDIRWVNQYYFRTGFRVTPGWSGSGVTNARGDKLLGIVTRGAGTDPHVLHFGAIRRVLGREL